MWHSLSRCGNSPKRLRRRNLDAPRVTLTAEEVAEYAGRYGDPSQVSTLAEKCEGLEVSTELVDQPGRGCRCSVPPQHHPRRWPSWPKTWRL
jgi:hypothetical protein